MWANLTPLSLQAAATVTEWLLSPEHFAITAGVATWTLTPFRRRFVYFISESPYKIYRVSSE